MMYVAVSEKAGRFGESTEEFLGAVGGFQCLITSPDTHL